MGREYRYTTAKPQGLLIKKKKSWHERLTAHIKKKKNLQSRGLLSVNTAKYIKENNKTADICAKIHIYLTVLITQCRGTSVGYFFCYLLFSLFLIP